MSEMPEDENHQKDLNVSPELSHCVRCGATFEGRPSFCDLRLGGCGRVYMDSDPACRPAWEQMMRDAGRQDTWEAALLSEALTLILLGPHPAEGAGPESGKSLFREVREVIEEHARLESPWASAIVALFVMQAYVAPILPCVSYLMIGGRFGHGKTKLLRLVMRLTGGMAFENVSVAALARSLKSGSTVGIDEYDVIRERDVQEIRDALVRQGYQADAAPYTRYNAAKQHVESFPVYGPKVLTFRGGVEDALQSRGYVVAMGDVEGEDGYRYVLRNMFPRDRGLSIRLKTWGEGMLGQWTPDGVRDMMQNGLSEDVRRAVQVLGANRDSELATVACAVARIVGVDLGEELRRASEARSIAIAASSDADVELCREIVLELAKGTVQAAIDESYNTVSIRQKDIRKAFDETRRSRGDRRLSDAAFAAIRRELGVKDAWLTRPGNLITWSLPTPWLTWLTRLTSTPYGEQVSHVSQVSQYPHDHVSTSHGPIRRVDDQDAAEMADFLDSVRFAIRHSPGHTDKEIAAAIGRDLGLDQDDVRGRVTAIRARIQNGLE
jgi:hypothetical protein